MSTEVVYLLSETAIKHGIAHNKFIGCYKDKLVAQKTASMDASRKGGKSKIWWTGSDRAFYSKTVNGIRLEYKIEKVAVL